MTHTALARKYRPTRFADLVAQEHVAAGLSGAVAKQRVAHAYLLTGPRGIGKTSAARILAMALNCENKGAADGPGEPCGECDSCKRIWAGATNLDVVEIDAASNRGVDDARELRERAMYAASGSSGYKVYIVDEAHMLTREAWNALLKILEEPPPRVVFVFATTEPRKIGDTAAPVLSRVQRFDFRRIGPKAIADRLTYVSERESLDVEEDAIRLIARVADGGLRDALSILDQVLAFGEGAITAARVRDALGLIGDELYGELLGLIAEKRTADVFPFVARIVESGADLLEFVNGAGEVLRALLIRILGGRPDGLTEPLRAALEEYAEHYTAGDLLRIIKLLGNVEGAIKRSGSSRLMVEALLVQWTLLDRTVELQEVLDVMRGGGVRQGPVAQRKGAPGPRAGSRQMKPHAERRQPAPVSPSTNAVKELWPQVLQIVGEQSRMVRESLRHATLVSAVDDVVVLEVSGGDVHMEGLERSRSMIAKVIAGLLGVDEVRIEYREMQEEPDTAPAAPAAPARLDRDRDRAERLRHYRGTDPGLDSLAEALDLEVVE
ncbi:MAG: DNA polymerase III subunit gamma/tau [Gemmatimonadales bacterium]